VWNWRGGNRLKGKLAVGDWDDIALNREVIIAYDGDVVRKPQVHQAMARLAEFLKYRGADVKYLHLPDTDRKKTGLDDYLTAGHTVEDLWGLVKPVPPQCLKEGKGDKEPRPDPKPEPVPPISLEEAHTVFHRWLGDTYDTDALDAMLAVVAVEKFDDGSDLAWLLIVSGPGNAKTETVQSCDGIGAVVISSISSEAALLSATPQRDRAADATGGLLRRVGDRGVLIIKDMTSILSMNRDTRNKVLSAFREIYDGRWQREFGTDGGNYLEWKGRIAVLGAVTTAWDTAHAVISSMGDRFLLLRMDSTRGREAAGRQAISNTGNEAQMRRELAAAVAGAIAGMNQHPITVTDNESELLLRAANLVTLARTAVEYDYRGDVIDAHAPEMPTRFAKQLTQILRGGVAIGMNRQDAMRLAIRCARDSMPPLRLSIIDDLAAHPRSTPTDVRKRLEKPRATVDRQLQALHILGVLRLDEETHDDTETGIWEKPRTTWKYSLAEGVDPETLKSPKGFEPDCESKCVY
jgi:hypothetical protein